MPKIVRVVTRLNIGGPAQHVVALSEELDRFGWETLLLIGEPQTLEGNMGHLLSQRKIRWMRIPSMGRELQPWKDFSAWITLLRTLLAERPEVLHTHTAKAGALGRLAGIAYRLLRRKRLVMIHTFHGHVLTGYFSPAASWVFRTAERWLALFTDCLIAVSPLLREDLVRLGVAPQEKIRVISLGLPLQHLRAIGPPPSEGPPAVGLVGRLVPVKNHALFLEAIRLLSQGNGGSRMRFLVIGDGELRQSLEFQADRMGLRDLVQFTGWQMDLPSIYSALHIVCLTSRNEGTPVSLIEAMAAGRPIVATDVGGVRGLLQDEGRSSAIPRGSFEIGTRGLLVAPDDAQALAQALLFLAEHPERCAQLGQAGSHFAHEHFSLERLGQDLNQLYRSLLVR